MRLKAESIFNFSWADEEGLNRTVREYRDEYKTLSGILDGRPEILDLADGEEIVPAIDAPSSRPAEEDTPPTITKKQRLPTPLFVLHRFSDSAASVAASPNNGIDDIAFSKSGQDRHTEVMISELNGWPAFPLADATPVMLPSPAYGSRPEQLAKFSLQDSFIPNPKPVYPGAFPDAFIPPTPLPPPLPPFIPPPFIPPPDLSRINGIELTTVPCIPKYQLTIVLMVVSL